MKRYSFLLVAIVIGFLLVPETATGQYSRYKHRGPAAHTEGLFLQGHLTGVGVEVEGDGLTFGDEDGNGGGLGVKVGYGFTPVFTLYAGLDVAVLDEFDPAIFGIETRRRDLFFDDEIAYFSFDLGTQFNFGSRRGKLVPYVDLALSYSGLAYELHGDVFGGEDVTVSGGGISVGGGLKYFIAPTVALDVSLTGTVNELEDVTIDGDEISFPGLEFDAGAARFGFGLSWYPTR